MKISNSVKVVVFSFPIISSSQLIIWNNFFIIGFIIMGLINWIWWHGGYVGSKYDVELEFLEHYHWAIILSIISIAMNSLYKMMSSIIYGASLILWIDECFYQDHPFAIKSSHEKLSDLIGSILTLTFIIEISMLNLIKI